MESIGAGDWELARPNVTTWASDLTDAPAMKELVAIRDRIFDLSKHIDTLTRPPILEEEDPATPEEEEHEETAPDPQEVEDDEDESEEMVENEPKVNISFFVYS